MATTSHTELEREPSSGPHAATPAAALLRWSVRRELWENRSIYIAPLAAAALMLLGSVIGALGRRWAMRAAPALDAAAQHAAVVRPYHMAPAVIVLAAFLVGIFYSLDALHGERRDRSILFWKSLPVSDLVTVLSKACIPLVVLPLLAFGLGAATQLVMVSLSTVVRMAAGLSAAPLWAELHVFQLPLILLYGIVTLTLWHAPLYGWLLLVSAWARRMPVLWAAFPPLAVCVVEKLAFNSAHFAALLGYRLIGSYGAAFVVEPQRGGRTANFELLTQLDPAKFLSTPGLWVGLVLAAAFLAAAARLRRRRGPL
jgi:ABC-2 type transport system permease protein